MLAAILNGPLANAFVTEHSTDHAFTNVMLASMPPPRKLDTVALQEVVLEYQSVLRENFMTLLQPDSSDARLTQLLVWVDALVLHAYDLPPRL